MPLTTVLAQPGAAEPGEVAARAVRRIGDALHDSPSPAASALALEAIETVLFEIEEALRLAAENAAASSPPARQTAEQLSATALGAVRLRSQLEAVAMCLRREAASPDAEPTRKHAAGARSVALPTPAASTPTAAGFERTAALGHVTRGLRRPAGRADRSASTWAPSDRSRSTEPTSRRCG
ncbi:hypothetical protein ACFC26_14955 [Kitasatospora purpeofusca]|uniref:hypothetical protein n=1 Tax=Kitasatospora purpeofusca TaxID=67352 RepID=UPI0035D9BA3D